MKRYHLATLLFVATILLLSGCSSSFNKEQKGAEKAVEEVLKEKQKKANNENDAIEYYLPFGFEVEEESPNNVILKNGSKAYILFYNEHEDSKSEVVYDTTMKQKKYDSNTTFATDDKFGFMLIKKLDNKTNELVVGIGGVKVTSEVRTTSLKSEATAMMKIANGVSSK